MVNDKLQTYMKPFLLTEDQSMAVYNSFEAVLHKASRKETRSEADIKCNITYIHDLPTGKERGQSLAIVIVGRSAVFSHALFQGKDHPVVKTKSYTISNDLANGPGRALFDYIAESLLDFYKKVGIKDPIPNCAFVVSFACKNQSLRKATLVKWTRNYSCQNVVGNDIGRMLEEALLRHKITMTVSAVLDCATATLLSCAHRHPECHVGIVINDGTNASYMEKTENLSIFEADVKDANPHTIVSTEWGAFGDKGTLANLRTEYDQELDAASSNPGQQIFEKMTSGLYLGELMRIILRDAAEMGLLFAEQAGRDHVIDVLTNRRNSFPTTAVLTTDMDRGVHYVNGLNVLKEVFDIDDVSKQDCESFLYIANALIKRSAHLIGIAASVLVNLCSQPKVVIAVEGFVYHHTDKYDEYMRVKLDKYVRSDTEWDVLSSPDGSGRGGALIALSYEKGRKSTIKN